MLIAPSIVIPVNIPNVKKADNKIFSPPCVMIPVRSIIKIAAAMPAMIP